MKYQRSHFHNEDFYPEIIATSLQSIQFRVITVYLSEKKSGLLIPLLGETVS